MAGKIFKLRSVRLLAIVGGILLLSNVLTGSSSSSSKYVKMYTSCGCVGTEWNTPYHSFLNWQYYCASFNGDGDPVKSWMVWDPASSINHNASEPPDDDDRTGKCNNCPICKEEDEEDSDE